MYAETNAKRVTLNIDKKVVIRRVALFLTSAIGSYLFLWN